MKAREFGKILAEIATLLELQGANNFKVRAYANAARQLRGSEESVAELAERAREEGVKGFGKDLMEHLDTAASEGSLPFLEQLRSEFPEGVLQILKIQGLGAKKVKALYEDLGISSIEELQTACEEGRVAELKGFAKKTEQNILAGIEQLSKYQDLFRFDHAEAVAQELLEYLRGSESCQEAEIAGSLRRGKEIVKDIDLIASSEDAESLMAHFSAYSDVARINAQGTTKSAVLLNSGIAVDLRVVETSAYPSALLHFTGSKEHNTELRSRAKKKNLKLNEYGLFEGDTPLELDSEEAIYQALGLSFLTPEIREQHIDVESPPRDLINHGALKGILHAHSTYSDGVNTLEEMARAAKEKGYEYLGITDHSQTAAYAGGLKEEDIRKQHDEIDALNEELAPFKIFKGIESDILGDGSLDYPDKILQTFDFIVASIHSRMSMSAEEMTKRLVAAAENPYTTILGHLSGRLLLQREPYAFDLQEVLEAAARSGTAVEINANPKRLDLDWRHHARALALGISMPITPDAHAIDQIDYVRYGITIARKGGLRPANVLNTLDRNAIEAEFQKRRP